MATELRDHRFTFDPEAHEYRLDGRVLVSVTQVLERAGLVDAAWFTEESRRRGTAVHAATHYLDEGDLDIESVDPAIEGYVLAYERFKREARFRPDIIEVPAYQSRWLYAGTPDRIVLGGGEVIPRCVLDLKTGAPEPWHALQLAAYANLQPEPFRFARLSLYLRDDWSYRLHEWPRAEYLSDLTVFLGALNVANWKGRHGR